MAKLSLNYDGTKCHSITLHSESHTNIVKFDEDWLSPERVKKLESLTINPIK